MKQTKHKFLAGLFAFLFIGVLFGIFLIPTSTLPQTQITEPGSFQSSATINTAGDLAAYNNSVDDINDIYIEPTEAIAATLYNYDHEAASHDFVIQHTDYPLNLEMKNINISRTFKVNGSPTVTANNVNVTHLLESLAYGIGITIGSPTLVLTDVRASNMRFRVTSGALTMVDCYTNSLSMIDFTTGAINSTTITGTLYVEGNTIVYIYNSNIGSLIETEDPVVTPAQSTYSFTYNFLFEPRRQVNVQWTALDNIRGPNYPLTYNISIYKNGVLIDELPPQTTPSHSLSVDTAAQFYEVRILCYDQQGNSVTETISIVPNPNLLFFIIMILGIAGGVVGVILIWYLRKQRQWQKTSLMEIPVG
jgi:hypothetical protein